MCDDFIQESLENPRKRKHKPDIPHDKPVSKKLKMTLRYNVKKRNHVMKMLYLRVSAV